MQNRAFLSTAVRYQYGEQIYSAAQGSCVVRPYTTLDERATGTSLFRLLLSYIDMYMYRS